MFFKYYFTNMMVKIQTNYNMVRDVLTNRQKCASVNRQFHLSAFRLVVNIIKFEQSNKLKRNSFW